MKRLRKHWPTFVAMLVNLIGMLMFASAFFSADDRMLSESEWMDFRSSLPHKMQQQMAKIEITCSPDYSKADFGKLVLIVIDALRADFIPSISPSELFKSSPSSLSSDPNETMPVLEALIKSNEAVALISEAQTPTVTMPRIKALLSGTYPSFMDLVMNLKAARFGDDNVLEQLHRKGKRIVFYGDDTWLQMFPSAMFDRSEGTSSFFATDYTTVDTNVTNRVLPELNRLADWDILILHYLGLDHIGHAHGGAYSKLVRPKLLEMDDVISQIHKSLSASKQPCLVLVTGDHGMTDAGNHGGSSLQETHAAAVFLNTSAHYQFTPKTASSPAATSKVMQIDIAITLSVLLGLPVPEKSRGKIILPVLKAMNVRSKRQLCHMNRNALQMQKLISPVVKSEISLFSKAISLHSEYLSTSSRSAASQSLKLYTSYIDRIQKSIMTGKSHKSLYSLLSIGIGTCLISCIMLIMVENAHVHGDGRSIFVHLLRKNTSSRIFASHLVLQILCLGSTSFIELESYYWHYVTSSLVLYHFVCEYLRKSYIRRRSGQVKEWMQDDGKKNDKSYRISSIEHEEKEEGNSLNDCRSGNALCPSTDSSPLQESHHLNHRHRHPNHHHHEEARSHYVNGSSSSCNGFSEISGQHTQDSGADGEESIHLNHHSDPDDRRSQTCLFLPFIPRPVVYAAVLLLLRISTSWTAISTNAVDPASRDIRSFLASEDQKHLLSSLVILTFFMLTFLTPATKLGKQHCILGAAFFFIYLFRTEEGSCKLAGFPVKILPEVGLDFSIPSVTKARIVYILILGVIVDAVLQRLKWISDDFITKWIPLTGAAVVTTRNEISKLSCLRIFSSAFVLLSALLLRTELIPLLGLNVLTEKLVHHVIPNKRYKSQLLLVIVYLTAGTSAFYAQGNSNAISTIDISSGYIGLQSYHLPLASLLVILSTYSLYIYWCVMLFVRLQERKSAMIDDPLRHMISAMNGLLIYRFASVTMFQLVAVILQNHLFIWSVVSPKLCYEAAMAILTNVLLILISISHVIDHQ